MNLFARILNRFQIWRARWLGPKCVVETIAHSQLVFDPQPSLMLREYYFYCINLLRSELQGTSSPLKVVVGSYQSKPDLTHRLVRVDLQYEHCIVRSGGRDSEGALLSNTRLLDADGFYLSRLQNQTYLEQLDLVIEYSQANITHLRNSEKFSEYLGRVCYLAPMIFAADFSQRDRPQALISLFADANQVRRREFLQAAEHAHLPLINFKSCYEKNALRELYFGSKVLVNVHQTEHHHTLEELRILPALLSGVIVISEDVPLRDSIPYAKFIVWSRYEDLLSTCATVLQNFTEYQARIFGDPELAMVLQAMQVSNQANLSQAILNLCDESKRNKK